VREWTRTGIFDRGVRAARRAGGGAPADLGDQLGPELVALDRAVAQALVLDVAQELQELGDQLGPGSRYAMLAVATSAPPPAAAAIGLTSSGVCCTEARK
jgi:hypothetical protein